MTAVLEAPRPVAARPKKKALVKNLHMTLASSFANDQRVYVGMGRTRVQLHGPLLRAYLGHVVLGSAAEAKLIGLDRLPSYEERRRWRRGSTVLMAVGNGEGAIVWVVGSEHALGYAKFCRGWRAKLGLQRGKVRYFRVMAAR